jgi:hypothetical protein
MVTRPLAAVTASPASAWSNVELAEGNDSAVEEEFGRVLRDDRVVR